LVWRGRHLSTDAINSLIRLVLHGVTLVDRSGERISVTSHLLRHAAAIVQRQQYGVPLEMLAEAMCQVRRNSGMEWRWNAVMGAETHPGQPRLLIAATPGPV